MPNVCILTDSTAQFTQPEFPGHKRVHVIPFGLPGGSQPESTSRSGSNPDCRCLAPPPPQEFARFYARLGQQYDSILVLLLSSRLNQATQSADAACAQYNNHVVVEVVDSQTTAIGLGMLVQAAAGAACAGASLTEIEQRLRDIIPSIYMLFCIPDLTVLASSGYIGRTQALVGEILGMLPIFAVEEGRLVPLEKVHTAGHLFDAFQDFLSEFESPDHIALVRAANRSSSHARLLRQFVRGIFPATPFSEHPIQPHLAALFGPQCIGLVIREAGH
jgi:DegV family protein with EDD domain